MRSYTHTLIFSLIKVSLIIFSISIQCPPASLEVPNIAKIFHGPVIANVGGFSLQEYAENCAKLNDVEQVSILEVNISCPNVHAGGRNFGSDPKAAAEVTRAVKAVTRKPVFMKLSPNVTDIAEIARACADAGADGICLINTLLGMRIDLKTKKPLIANRTGGLSGPAVFPVAVRMVWDVYEAVQLPIIGCGGGQNYFLPSVSCRGIPF